MNINELTAFTDQQLDNPATRRIQKHQMIRLRDIAAKHNAKMPKDSSFKNKVRAERIASLLGARGALAGVANDGITITHNSRQEPDGFGGENEVDKTAPIYPKSLLDIGYSNYNSRRNSEIRGQNLRRFEKQMRKNNTIREKNNMNIKEYYKQILNSEINEKLIGKQHKIDADGNKVINRKDFAIINAKKKSAMNAVDEGYARSNRINDSMRRKVERGIAVPAGLRSAGKIAVKKARRADKKRGLLDFEDEMNEATPAEIQAHQISRLDRIGNKFNGGEYGADLRKPRNLRAGRRIANLYKKAGVLGGFRPYSGLAGEDPVMIRTDTWPAYPEAIKNANAELKRDRGSNRTVGRKIRGFIKRTTGLEEMNQVDEMALTKKAFNTMLKGVKKARDMGDANSGRKAARHWKDEAKQSDALIKALQSPKLYDIGPKGGLGQIGRLKGKDPAQHLTYAANFRTKVPKDVLRSAKELAKLHGMFYVTHHGNDAGVTNPLGKTVAVGGKQGPTSGFIRQSRKVSDGFDQNQYY